MFAWIEKLLKIPSALSSAKITIQSEKNKEPVRRFVQLFEAHGVARTEIPRFLKNYNIAITLSDLNTDDSLLKRMDEPLLEKVCDIFSIRREWLDGVDTQIHPCHDFYKRPKQFAEFVRELRAKNCDAWLNGVLIAPEEGGNVDALLILEETIGYVGEKPIYRYHLCNNWLFSYWKARGYLTACIAIAWKEDINIYGIYLPQKEIKKLAYGRVLLGWKGEGLYSLGHTSWYPEDMALLPDAFLKGVDLELENVGIKSALELWLRLEKEGLMDTGLGKSGLELFQQRLE